MERLGNRYRGYSFKGSKCKILRQITALHYGVNSYCFAYINGSFVGTNDCSVSSIGTKKCMSVNTSATNISAFKFIKDTLGGIKSFTKDYQSFAKNFQCYAKVLQSFAKIL